VNSGGAPDRSARVSVEIPFGADTLKFDLPRRCLVDVLRPNQVEPADEAAVLASALARPVGSPPLRQVARAGMSVAVLVDDLTRRTPADRILPPVLAELHAGGVRTEDITIVVALGTHRPMTPDEIERKIGRATARAVRACNHDCRDRQGLVHLGRSRSGTQVWVNRQVAQADLRVAVGAVIPHGAVGYAGGGKMIYPGVAGADTVEEFHVAANLDPRNRSGVNDAPARLEIEEMVQKVGLEFIVNVVTTADGRVYEAVCGHYVRAHRRGIPAAQRIYGVAARRQVDILIVSSHPADLDFWQAGKAIYNCQSLVRDGGSLIIVTPCPEGIPREHAAFAEYIGRDPEELAAAIRSGSVPDRITAAPAVPLGRFRRRIRMAVVSPGISAAALAPAKMEKFDSVEEAAEEKMAEYGAGAGVSVVTHGGETVPYVEP